MSALVRIINPNSNTAVTAAMSESVEPLRARDGPLLDCITLADGPFGIESQADADAVVPLLEERVTRDDDAGAFVIGCYSDPGLEQCRRATARPVFGIQECAALLAISRGGAFGVLSLGESSVERHWRHLRALGLDGHCAGDRPVGLTVAESESGSATFDRLTEVGALLRDADGARCLILGCTGMARHREALERAVGIPVIEPTQAAASVAVGAVQLGW